MEKVLHSKEEMFSEAKGLIATLVVKDTATVIALSGDLGAGKTTFSQGVAQVLGVDEYITSPTFVIQKIYILDGQRFDRLVHMDAYRLHGAHELEVLGWHELLQDPKTLVLIEWPEQVGEAIPRDAIKITFTFIDESTRAISIT